jgi:hypothetical protein
VNDNLVATAAEAAGGQKLWDTLRGLTVDLSVGGPPWAMVSKRSPHWCGNGHPNTPHLWSTTRRTPNEHDHHSRKSAPMHVFEVRNAELIESLTQQCAEQGITYAAIVTLIGAIDSFTVSTNPAGDPTAHTYSSYPLPAEMTATGEIVDGKPHIHAVMAVQGDRTIGGHLHTAHLGTSFARAYVIPSEYHVAVPAHEQIVFEQFPDEAAPAGRGRLNDTRVGAAHPVATGSPAVPKLGS